MSQDTNVDQKKNKDDEKKVEENNGEDKKDEEKKEEKKEEKPIIIRVDMHCKACEDSVKKALDGYPGVENVHTDMKNQTVIVKGKVVVRKVFELLKKKSGRRAILLSPELEEEEKKQEEIAKEPVESSVVLKVKMHCLGCSREVKRGLLKLPGVTSVDVDFANDQVTVKGRDLDPKKVCDGAKKSGKHYEIVPPPPPPPSPPQEEKKEEEKKEEEKKEEKKEEEKKEEKKEEEKKEEEKKEEKPDEKNDDKPSGEIKNELKKYEYGMYTSFPEYVYPPQLFSDENPNACHVM